MGNSQSDQQQPNGHGGQYLARSGTRSSTASTVTPASSAAAAPVPNIPHRSLRHKKKSLELPDLASLALTSAGGAGSGVRTPGGRPAPPPPTSTPINIPHSAGGQPTADHERAPRALPSTHDLSQLLLQPPAPTGTGVRSSHFRGAPLPYNSTRDFAGGQAVQRTSSRQDPAIDRPGNVYSTIPVGLDIAGGRPRQRPEPVAYRVYWRGLAQSVVLARAGHDNWKGRQSMEKDPNKVDLWSTVVYVHPGTHHIKFIVDEQWRVSDEYHKAVADDGSLANYIAIPIPAERGLVSPPRHKTLDSGMSFWSGGTDDDASMIVYQPGDPRGWTDEIPPELEAAAEEEEVYQARVQEMTPAGAPDIPAEPPTIPFVPLLPRFLEKVILNQRPGGAPNVAGRDRTAERARAREREAAARDRPHGGMPVTTASGTDIARAAPGWPSALSPLSPATASPTASTPSTHAITPRRPTNIPRLDMPAHLEAGSSTGRTRSQSTSHQTVGAGAPSGAVHAVADDNAVLPVPSHVILHHLCTSAIRNGVLAVANTTRYRKKYLTVVYYKPT